MKFDNSLVNLNHISNSIMKNRLIAIIGILLVLSVQVIGQGCSVCSRCKDCTADVLGDQYIDAIDALLQKKIEQLGYPEQIKRTAAPRNITYSIEYSSGLTIQLALALDNMQIQLLNYTFDQAPITSVQASFPASSRNDRRTSDGYFAITDLANNMQIAQMTRFLSKVVQASMANFKLISAEYTLQPVTIYRLNYQILTFSNPLVETVYIQSLGNGGYQLLESNYSQLQPPALKAIDPLAILNDVWLPRINSLIIDQYSNLLGQRPSILGISQQEPYYQFRYQVADTNYTFFVMYDYIQNRIIHGNITITRRGQSQAAGATTSATASSSASPTRSTLTSTTTTTSSQTRQSSVGTASLATRSGSTDPASFLSSSQTSSSSQTVPSTQQVSSSHSFSSTYSDLPNALSSQEASTIVSYLRSLNIQFSNSDIRSIKAKKVGPTIFYQFIIELVRIPTTRTIFYQIQVAIDRANQINLSDANYVSLDSPQFVVLTLQQITEDSYIRQIAKFLLDKQYASLTADSRVIQIERDFPYYRLTFASNQQTFVAITALFNLFTRNIQVMSANTQQTSTSNSANTQSGSSSITNINRQQNTVNSQAQSPRTNEQINRARSTNSQGTSSTSSSITQNLVQVPRVNSATTSSQSQQTINLVRVPQISDQKNQQTVQTTQTNSQATQAQTSPQLVPARQTTNTQPIDGLVPATKVSPAQQSQQNNQITGQNSFVQTSLVNNSQSMTSQMSSSTQTSTSSPSASSTSTSSSVAGLSRDISSPLQGSSFSSVTSQVGFQRLRSEDNEYYSYVVAGMRKLNGTFYEKGISGQDIKYTDILYKVEENILTIILKVEVQGKQYAFQYQGPINNNQPNQIQTTVNNNRPNPVSNNQQTSQANANTNTNTASITNSQTSNTAQTGSSSTSTSTSTSSSPSTSTSTSSGSTSSPSRSPSSASVASSTSTVSTSSSSSSGSASSNIVSYQGSVYNRIPTQMAQQAYITLYLKYLVTTSPIYTIDNLVGIFTNPMVPYSLLFRYYANNQYHHILTTPTDIQQTLVRYYNQKNAQQTNNNQASNPQINSQQQQSPPTTNIQQTQNRTNNQQTQVINTAQQTQTQVNSQQGSTSTSQTINNVQQRPIQMNTQQNQIITQQQIQPSSSNSQTQRTQQANLIPASQSAPNLQPAQQSITQQTQGRQQVQGQQISQNRNQNQPASGTQYTTINSTSSSSRSSIVSVDPNCLCYDGTRCMRCAHRYYLKNNQCISIPLECLSYDLTTGACYSCIPGYTLSQGLCQPQAPVAYYFNNTCVTCFGNYKMVNRRCVYSPAYDPTSPNYSRQKNILCFAWQGSKCVECIPGGYLSSRGICELVDPFCSLFDYIQQVCNTCQEGYSVRNGRCFKKI